MRQSLAPNDANTNCSGLLKALRSADAEVVRALIHGAYRQGYAVETIADQMIGPAMTELGDEWQRGEIEIFHEHRATQCVVSALHELTSFLNTDTAGTRPVAFGGAPEHDYSIIPSLLAKLVLLDAGWDAVDLGPHTPIGAFRTAVADLKPRLIWLSASHLVDPERFVSDYIVFFREIESSKISIVIGGQAVSESIRSSMPYSIYGEGLTDLAEFAKLLHRLPHKARRGRPRRSDKPGASL